MTDSANTQNMMNQFNDLNGRNSVGRTTLVVVPVFNHATMLGDVLTRLQDTQLPILVVNDGSTDGSGDVAANFDGVRVVSHKDNMGKGAAIITALLEASGKYDQIVTLDADGQHDPVDIPGLLAAVPGDHPAIVVGERMDMSAPDVPRSSRIGRAFSNFWVLACGGIPVRDSQSGFRVYPVSATLAMSPRARRFQFEVEVLVLAAWNRLPVISVPVHVSYPGSGKRISHYRPLMDFWRNSVTFSTLLVARFMIPRFLRLKWWCSGPIATKKPATGSVR